ncbi:MAG: ABC transporter ATP-binding protein [Thioploca sp.]|nr:ABC transporter ATP-binding protein [Thioploca sp.]
MSDLLELSHITKTYRVGEARVEALKGIDLDLNSGEFVAIGGPSGSGKSTLLNICGLLDQPDQGEYRFSGQNTKTLAPTQLTRLRRDYIGFIFQHFNLIPVMNALENVEYPLMLTQLVAKERRTRATMMLDKVGLSELYYQLPDQMSGGQRQRVAIARALVKHPQLVIADEPTANLDTITANQIIDLMHELSTEQNTTFLIATHDERMVRRCGRKLHLVDGVWQS